MSFVKKVLTDTHFLHLARNNMEAGLPKLMLLRPLGRNFVIMGYKFNNRELLEVTDIKRLNLPFVNKGTNRSSSDHNIKLNISTKNVLSSYFCQIC